MLKLTFFLFGCSVTLILFLDATFAFCNQRQIGFPLNFGCRLVFLNVTQRNITFSRNLLCRLVFPIDGLGLLSQDCAGVEPAGESQVVPCPLSDVPALSLHLAFDNIADTFGVSHSYQKEE